MTAEAPFARKLAVGILTQGLFSLSNLIVRVWLARELPKSQYGLYALGFETIFVFLSLQNALFSTPLAVLLPEKRGEDRRSLLGGLELGQWLVLLPLVVLLTASAAVAGSVAGFAKVAWAFPLALAVPASWWREFGRVVLYSELRVNRVLLMDFAFLLLAVGGIAVLDALGALSGPAALAALGCAYLASAAVGRLAGGTRYSFEAASIRSAFRQTWEHSRWTLVGTAATMVQLHGYVYFVSVVAGLESTADLSAARVLVMPFALLIASCQRIFVAKGAQIHSRGEPDAFRRYAGRFLLLFLACWVLYAGLLLALHGVLIRTLFTEKYGNIEPYLLFWMILGLVSACRFVVTYSLQVFKAFKLLALVGLASAAAVATLCLLLLPALGASGAVVALIGGEGVLLLFCLPGFLRRLRKRCENHEGNPAPQL